MKNLFGEKVAEKKRKKEKVLNVYEVVDREEGYAYFFIAHSHGSARSAYCGEVGLSFDEAFHVEIHAVPRLQKYIEKSPGNSVLIELWEDKYWMQALYAEGGSFTNGACESNGDDDILTIDEMIDRECRHKDGTKCDGWDDERIWVNLPRK